MFDPRNSRREKRGGEYGNGDLGLSAIEWE